MANLTILVIFILYLIAVFAIGYIASIRSEHSARGYFLAGNKLPWYAIGGSLIASNISTHHFIGFAGLGYQSGMGVASYEWIAILGLIILAFVFLPFYLGNKVYTLPEYLERRYDYRVRTLLSASSIFIYIVAEMGVVLFAGALALSVMFNVDISWTIIGVAVFTGSFTIMGGLPAVVWTELLQTALLIGGGLTVSFIGVSKIGGWSSLFVNHSDKFHTVFPADHPDFPWPGIFLGGLHVLNIYYWANNQFIVQRALGARSDWDGKMGALFAGSLKLIIPFVVVIPGIVASVLFPDLTRGDEAFAMVVKNLLPPAVAGLVLAALLAAMMSSIESMLNSSATLITFDFYKRFFRPNAPDKKLIRFGRYSAAVCLAFSTFTAILIGKFSTGSIFLFVVNVVGYVAPPAVVVFLFGIFWKRGTARGALWALIIGLFASVFFDLLPKIPWDGSTLGEISPIVHYMGVVLYRTMIVFWISTAVLWIVSKKDQAPGDEKTFRLTWGTTPPEHKTPLSFHPKNTPFWAAVLMVVVISLYIIFA